MPLISPRPSLLLLRSRSSPGFCGVVETFSDALGEDFCGAAEIFSVPLGEDFCGAVDTFSVALGEDLSCGATTLDTRRLAGTEVETLVVVVIVGPWIVCELTSRALSTIPSTHASVSVLATAPYVADRFLDPLGPAPPRGTYLAGSIAAGDWMEVVVLIPGTCKALDRE